MALKKRNAAFARRQFAEELSDFKTNAGENGGLQMTESTKTREETTSRSLERLLHDWKCQERNKNQLTRNWQTSECRKRRNCHCNQRTVCEMARAYCFVYRTEHLYIESSAMAPARPYEVSYLKSMVNHSGKPHSRL